jgi:cell division protein FtsN
LKYSVQVGAFRQAEQAASRASALKARGYPCNLIPPGGTNELYLVTVGAFDSRADAVAMQLRLKKDGFSSFIKTSR